MAKKKEIVDNTKYLSEQLEDIMGDRFGRYAKYIIQERALPDARDGLKPVQRRILYAMYHDGNTWDHPYRKSAKTVGLVIGNYHPHGDISVYDAMVRMSQDWKVRLPLIDMHGNNGSIDDDPPAAMRYTEVRLAKVTQVMEDDLDKDTVEMTPNFDDTENEPTVLPVPFPVMLVNGATGIAAGYATNMPPHNLGEVVDAAIYRLYHPDCTLADIMQIMPGPDFPTGGIVQGKEGIENAFSTGRGRIVVRGRCTIEDTRSCQQIVITEIPYEVIKGALVRQMDEIRLNKEIDGILDVRDESDRNGMRIVIDVRKDADAQTILNYFYKNTDLQIYYNYNNVAIIDKSPVQVGVIGLLDAFIEFRKEVVRKRSQYEYDKAAERSHVIEGLMKAISILDEVIHIIRSSKDKAEAEQNLIHEFGFDEVQADAIVSLRLYRLCNTDIVQLRSEYGDLEVRMNELEAILHQDSVLKSVIQKELRQVKKDYNSPRRTTIEEQVENITIDKTKMIPNDRVMLTVSADGYLKRVSLRSYSDSTPTGIKAGDYLVGSCEANMLDTLLLVTNKGNYVSLPVYQIDEAKWKDIGTHLNKYSIIDGQEIIISAILITDFNTYAWLVTVSRDGQIKKTPMQLWQSSKITKAAPAMKLAPERELASVFIGYKDDTVCIVSKNGNSYQFPLEQVPANGIKSKGVKAINLGTHDEVASACALSKASMFIYLCKDGMAKRMRRSDVPELSRPAKGIQIARQKKTNPYQVSMVFAVENGQILHFSDVDVPVMDIPLKTKENGFSKVTSLHADMIASPGIQECRIIDIPENPEEVHNDVEKLQLNFEEDEDE